MLEITDYQKYHHFDAYFNRAALYKIFRFIVLMTISDIPKDEIVSILMAVIYQIENKK